MKLLTQIQGILHLTQMVTLPKFNSNTPNLQIPLRYEPTDIPTGLFWYEFQEEMKSLAGILATEHEN